MNIGADCTLQEQCRLLEEILRQNHELFHVITSIDRFKLSNYYVAAGCISQTVWNFQSGNDIHYGINDIDVIYFDDSDLTSESEKIIEQSIREYYSDIKYTIDVTNEAGVHLWYHKKFGVVIPPYTSSESAVNSWIPATAVGVRYTNSTFCVYAPYGLNDLFGRLIRPNKLLMTQQHYEEKAAKWKSKWDGLKTISWQP
jgi:hypothetical protein